MKESIGSMAYNFPYFHIEQRTMCIQRVHLNSAFARKWVTNFDCEILAHFSAVNNSMAFETDPLQARKETNETTERRTGQ